MIRSTYRRYRTYNRVTDEGVRALTGITQSSGRWLWIS